MLPNITPPLQYSITPKRFFPHGGARDDFAEDSLLRFEFHDRRANERVRLRRIQCRRRFASATISKWRAAEARLVSPEALTPRILHVSNHSVRSRSIFLHRQQSLLFAKCSDEYCGRPVSPDRG